MKTVFHFLIEICSPLGKIITPLNENHAFWFKRFEFKFAGHSVKAMTNKMKSIFNMKHYLSSLRFLNGLNQLDKLARKWKLSLSFSLSSHDINRQHATWHSSLSLVCQKIIHFLTFCGHFSYHFPRQLGCNQLYQCLRPFVMFWSFCYRETCKDSCEPH